MKKLFIILLTAVLLIGGCTSASPADILITPLPAAETRAPILPDSAGIPTVPPLTPKIQETAAQPAEQAAKPAPETPLQTEEQPKSTALQEQEKPSGRPLAGLIIGVDPGHQKKANRDMEPVAPGSEETKHKVSSGTRGIETQIPEYEVNLAVGLLLKDLLEDAGAAVIMSRTANDVDISNVERAKLFNENKTDYAIRLHCNGSDDHDKRGAFMLVPTDNPFKEDCERAAQLMIDEYCASTGLKNRGLTYRSDQTGFNWSEVMIINIEMGHMTNADEDKLLTSGDFQVKMARGVFNGILKFFE